MMFSLYVDVHTTFRRLRLGVWGKECAGPTITLERGLMKSFKKKLDPQAIILMFSFLMFGISAEAGTPFVKLNCDSLNKQLKVIVEMDESNFQHVSITGYGDNPTGQTIYHNFKLNEVLSIVANFEHQVFTASLGFAGEPPSTSNVFQLMAIPGTMRVSGLTVKKAKFEAMIPALTTYLPLPHTGPPENSNPFDGKHKANTEAIKLSCDLEMLP